MTKLIAYILIAAAALLALPVALKMFRIYNFLLPVVILFHGASAVLCSLGFLILTDEPLRIRKRANVWWIYALLLCLTLPLYGIIMTVAMYIGQSRRKIHPPPIVEDKITVQDPSLFTRRSHRSTQLEVLDRLDIEPFIDIFRTGQSELKISAVKLLGTMKSKKAIATLMHALMDEDIEVRLFAAGVLGSMEDEYALGIDKKKSKLSENIGDKKLAMDLASYYISYAQSGLLDKIARDYYYGATVSALDNLPLDTEVLFTRARAHLALDELDEALVEITQCTETDPKNPAYEMLMWEILFAMGNYGMLATRVREAEEHHMRGADKDIATFWS